jgi:hypothetical protein
VNGFRGGALKHKFVECLHEFISFMYVYQLFIKSSFRLGFGSKGVGASRKSILEVVGMPPQSQGLQKHFIL